GQGRQDRSQGLATRQTECSYFVLIAARVNGQGAVANRRRRPSVSPYSYTGAPQMHLRLRFALLAATPLAALPLPIAAMPADTAPDPAPILDKWPGPF